MSNGKMIKRNKIYILSCFFFVSIVFISSSVCAKLTGSCSDCHTMHNSQNAASMNLGKTFGIASGAGECLDCHAANRAVLLRMDCLGCHAQDTSGASNIVDPGGLNMPQIAHNAATDLSGGNYSYVINNDDTCGHNVHGFGDAVQTDTVLGNTPPGYDSSFDPSSGGYQDNTAGQIMCAGQNGCHGNRNEVSQIKAIRGTHHADDTILKFGAGFTETGQGATAGTSYRYLYKVHGAEDSDWEATSSTDHNEYKGGTSHSTSQNWGTIDTISEFCAECHGDYHSSSGIGTSSPWLRHPTDVTFPTTGEYTGYTTYSDIAPVARQTIANGTMQASATVTTGSGGDIVMCLSCHRAHASEWPKIMRWNYQGWPGAGTNGCGVCHTSKN
jgi:hypothetical protein